MTELAPDACIVCGKPRPLTPDGRQYQSSSWFYLAAATPLGSMACSPECATVAVERFQKTGRCDSTGEKS